MQRKDVFINSFKQSEMVKTLPMKISDKLSSKSEATFVSDVLFQRQFLVNGCYISFNDSKGHEFWLYKE